MVHLNKDGASVSNLTIDGEDNFTYNLYISGSGTYYIDNVISQNGAYALNAQTGTKTLNISNSTFNGWVSYSSVNTVNFTDCSFGKGSKYAYIRPMGQTTFKNCKFLGTEYTIDVTKLASGKTITFDNCYVGNEKITKDNIETLVTVEGSITETNAVFK